MPTCSVRHCTNHVVKTNVKFFQFRKVDNGREWLLAINRKEGEIKTSSGIFKNNKFHYFYL